jgi:transglutaminase-like putative cysteine protease
MLSRWIGLWTLLLAGVGIGLAGVPDDTPQTRVLHEVWFERRTPAGKIGWFHQRSVEEDRHGTTLIRTTQREATKYLRSGDPYTEEDSAWSLERTDGSIVELGYRTSLGKSQHLHVRGVPQGDRIRLHVLDNDGKTTLFSLEKPWDPATLGLYAQERYLEGRRLEPGASFSYIAFQTTLNRCVRTTYTIVGPKATQLRGVERELIQVRQTWEKDLYFDPSTVWLDPLTGRMVKSEDESTTFGRVMQEVVPAAVALADFDGNVRDIEAPIAIDQPLNLRRGPPKELRVRVEHSSDDDLATLFPQDGRQKVLGTQNGGVELRLLAKADPEAEPPAQLDKPGPEYLESNFYIRSDHPDVLRRLKEAVGDATGGRRQMRLIRQWVRRNVKGDYEVPFATADEVARTLEGDCTEMGVLTAALGRAAGIPTRVAFGLVYDPENPGFGGHLWTEAYVDGRWEIFDATGVVPLLGAAFIKIGDYSMKDMLNPDEAAAVRRAFAGRMKVFVLEAR